MKNREINKRIMKTWGIETHWGDRGTVIYVIGQYSTKEDAYNAAIKGFKWFTANPDINNIRILND